MTESNFTRTKADVLNDQSLVATVSLAPAKATGLLSRIVAVVRRAEMLYYSIFASLSVPAVASAQTLNQTETNGISALQLGMDVAAAVAAMIAFFFGIRAGLTIASSSRKDGGGQVKPHHAGTDFIAALVLASVGVIIYELQKYMFTSAASGAGVYAPSISPTAG